MASKIDASEHRAHRNDWPISRQPLCLKRKYSSMLQPNQTDSTPDNNQQVLGQIFVSCFCRQERLLRSSRKPLEPPFKVRILNISFFQITSLPQSMPASGKQRTKGGRQQLSEMPVLPPSAEESSFQPLDTIPVEILQLIFLQLRGNSILSMLSTNSHYYRLIKDDARVYKKMLTDLALFKMLKIVDKISSEQFAGLEQKITWLCRVVKLKALVDQKKVDKLFQEALALVEAADSGSSLSQNVRTQCLSIIASAQVFSNIPEALATIELIEDKTTKENVLCEIAKMQAASNIPQALMTTQRIENNFLRYTTLCEIAKAEAATDIHKALNTLNIKEDTENYLTIKEAALRSLVAIRAKTDALHALEIAKSIQNDLKREKARCRVVKHLAKAEYDNALNIIEEFHTPYRKVQGLCKVASMLLAHNKGKAQQTLDRALEAAQTLLDPDERENFDANFSLAKCLQKIAQVYSLIDPIEANRLFQQAFDIARTRLRTKEEMSDGYLNTNAQLLQCQIIKSQASINTSQAILNADCLEEDRDREDALCTIALVQARTDIHLALSTVGNIQSVDNKAVALSEVAQLPELNREVSNTLFKNALDLVHNLIPKAQQMPIFLKITQALIK